MADQERTAAGRAVARSADVWREEPSSTPGSGIGLVGAHAVLQDRGFGVNAATKFLEGWDFDRYVERFRNTGVVDVTEPR